MGRAQAQASRICSRRPHNADVKLFPVYRRSHFCFHERQPTLSAPPAVPPEKRPIRTVSEPAQATATVSGKLVTLALTQAVGHASVARLGMTEGGLSTVGSKPMNNFVASLPDGRFDVQDCEGRSLLDALGGPFEQEKQQKPHKEC